VLCLPCSRPRCCRAATCSTQAACATGCRRRGRWVCHCVLYSAINLPTVAEPEPLHVLEIRCIATSRSLMVCLKRRMLQANFTCPICRTSLFATRGGGLAAAVTNSAVSGCDSRGSGSLSSGSTRAVDGNSVRPLVQHKPCSAAGPLPSPSVQAAAAAYPSPGPLHAPTGLDEAAPLPAPAVVVLAASSGGAASPRQQTSGAFTAHRQAMDTEAAASTDTAAAATTAEDEKHPQLHFRLPPPPPLRRSLDQLLPAGALAAQELSAAAAARARAALQDLAARLAAGRTSAAQQVRGSRE
jgi:hypothetical protein